ncbi:acyl-CoA synthetase [Sporosarcina sp. P13]|uniref:AMP-binding protein n=1 Tax=Sporosarcina sp. P13 TaxID=2048263 RepID=UPI000C163403|nr:AMP-binding protein [Sporosarcina sp. P13]PIC62690.1 acyl-CoA synthetase [Sporosarcina sp. P13]
MNEQTYLEHLVKLREKNWPKNLPRESHYPFGELLITDYLKKWAETQPNKPCIIWYGEEITFKQLDDLSDKFAAFLSESGMRKGDRVAVFLPNCPQFLIAFYGILKIGCIHVPVNPMFKKQELLYELNDTQAELIVTTDYLYTLVQEVKEDTSVKIVVTTSLRDYIPEFPTIPVHQSLLVCEDIDYSTTDVIEWKSIVNRQSTSYPPVKLSLDDIAALNYTGGTTGLPKGCEHTQRNMIYTCATASTFTSKFKMDDVVMAYFPSFWIAGQNVCVLLPVFTGATHIILGRWDAEAVLQGIAKYKVTHIGGVLDNFVELMNREDITQYNLSTIKEISVTSFVKKLNQEYRKKWRELSGSTMREMAYGMTETHTFDTFTTHMQDDDMDLKSQPVFSGLPMPGTELKIVSFETGEIVPLDVEGEIVIKTPSLLKSYWNKPEETKQSIKNGWLHTGDVGVIDQDGYLHFLGRRKEMLKVNGMSVSPPEIESIICRHPAVVGCGVIAKKHQEKGEVPVAFIQIEEEHQSTISEEDFQKWCHDQMSVYKVPIVSFIDKLPMTATGKVKKEELKKYLLRV